MITGRPPQVSNMSVNDSAGTIEEGRLDVNGAGGLDLCPIFRYVVVTLENFTRVIGLCGKTGAGKDEVAKYLQSTLWEALIYKHSGVLREMLEMNERPAEAQNMSNLFEAIAGQLGYAWLARVVIRNVRDDPRNPSPERLRTIVGIRNTDEVIAYREAFGDDFRLVAVHADEMLRYPRVRNRDERAEEQDMTFEAFQRFGQLGANTGESAVIDMADDLIINHATLEKLHEIVRYLPLVRDP